MPHSWRGLWPIFDSYIERVPTLGKAVLCFAAIIAITPFLLLGWFNHPSADDFCVANSFRSNGFWAATVKNYLNWNGRYTATALIALSSNPLDLIDHYKFAPLFLFTVTWLALTVFIATLSNSPRIRGGDAVAGLCALLLYLSLMAKVSSGFYWLSAAYTYQTGNLSFLLFVTLIIITYRRLRARRPVAWPVAAMSGLIAFFTGTNEVLLIPLLALLPSVITLHKAQGLPRTHIWLIVLGVALACVSFVYFAPGNEGRGANFPLRGQPSYAVAKTWLYGGLHLQHLLSQPLLWLGTLAWVFYYAETRANTDAGRRPRLLYIWLVGICCLSIPYLLLFPAWWATGEPAPERTVNVAYFVFLIAWFVLTTLIAQRYLMFGRIGLAIRPLGALRQTIYFLAILALAGGLLTDKVVHRARFDLFTKAPSYHAAQTARYAEVRRHSGSAATVRLPRLENVPETIHFDDIRPQTGNWRNQCFARFFNVSAVVTE